MTIRAIDAREELARALRGKSDGYAYERHVLQHGEGRNYELKALSRLFREAEQMVRAIPVRDEGSLSEFEKAIQEALARKDAEGWAFGSNWDDGTHSFALGQVRDLIRRTMSGWHEAGRDS